MNTITHNVHVKANPNL